MSNAEELEKDPNIVWEDRISKNGKKFKIGYHKDAEMLDKSYSKKPFNVKVDWPVVPESTTWIVQSSSFIEETGISRYYLNNDTTIPPYVYFLNFTCQVHYDYYFTDESGDIYQCDVFRNGNHYVAYNSDSPNIMNISGS